MIHFHGGLVSKEAGLGIAERLLVDRPVYSPSAQEGGYPVFYVWESSAWETIRNNFTELADEPVFKQLLRKLVQYALERLRRSGDLRAGKGALGAAGFARFARGRGARSLRGIPGPSRRREAIPFRSYDALAEPGEGAFGRGPCR
ncbi:MAG: hypothetical protein MZW92_31575 [Comamonadaceae bacterium]|nr:hypothetical protein [Comamonadaceae bacterium]